MTHCPRCGKDNPAEIHTCTPLALVLADWLDTRTMKMLQDRQAAAELRRLHAENEAMRKAYWKMRNAAAGYSNYCEESASTRRCEREYTEAEEMFRAAMKGQP